jgi:anti-sigma regulatory factor (Ser/Thr protein kinase)
MTSEQTTRPTTVSPPPQARSAGQLEVPGSAALPQRTRVRAPVLRVLPGAPESAATARRLTRRLLGDDHPATETAVLLVSELVTNSVMHSRSGQPGGTVTVALCDGAAGVLIQVRDDGGPGEPRLPRVNGGHPDRPRAGGACPDGARPDAADHGYGLVLVAALADTWGSMTTAEGRLTWCRVSGALSD